MGCMVVNQFNTCVKAGQNFIVAQTAHIFTLVFQVSIYLNKSSFGGCTNEIHPRGSRLEQSECDYVFKYLYIKSKAIKSLLLWLVYTIICSLQMLL